MLKMRSTWISPSLVDPRQFVETTISLSKPGIEPTHLQIASSHLMALTAHHCSILPTAEIKQNMWENCYNYVTILTTILLIESK